MKIKMKMSLIIVCTPPRSRVGLEDFAISYLSVGLGFFKNQGGVAIVGWGCFFQGGVDLFSLQKLFHCNFVCFHFGPHGKRNK